MKVKSASAMAGVVNQVRQTEAHLGIRCFVGQGKRVSGLFKYQPEDFQVYEIPRGQRALRMQDVFEYELNHPMGIYGSVPFLHAHGGARGSLRHARLRRRARRA